MSFFHYLPYLIRRISANLASEAPKLNSRSSQTWQISSWWWLGFVSKNFKPSRVHTLSTYLKHRNARQIFLKQVNKYVGMKIQSFVEHIITSYKREAFWFSGTIWQSKQFLKEIRQLFPLSKLISAMYFPQNLSALLNLAFLSLMYNDVSPAIFVSFFSSLETYTESKSACFFVLS